MAITAEDLAPMERPADYVERRPIAPYVGSPRIAARSVGRVCLGLEIEPRYVNICIKRWQRLTGRDAPLEGSAVTFNSRLTIGDPGPETEAQLPAGD